MNTPKPQSEVVAYFREKCAEVASVGGYVRVSSGDFAKTCFGPMGDAEPHGWVVVEIDWKEREFLLAPRDYRTTIQDTPDFQRDTEHHNAPKDANDDPVFEE